MSTVHVFLCYISENSSKLPLSNTSPPFASILPERRGEKNPFASGGNANLHLRFATSTKNDTASTNGREECVIAPFSHVSYTHSFADVKVILVGHDFYSSPCQPQNFNLFYKTLRILLPVYQPCPQDQSYQKLSPPAKLAIKALSLT